MIVRQPLELTKHREVRHRRHHHRRRHHRPGRCDPPRHRPRAGRVRRNPEDRAAQGRFHDPRCARSRAQEGRPAQGTSRHPVLQALIRVARWRCRGGLPVLSVQAASQPAKIGYALAGAVFPASAFGSTIRSIAPSPSGKAPDSDSGIRRFESFRGCQIRIRAKPPADGNRLAPSKNPAWCGVFHARGKPCPHPSDTVMIRIKAARNE
jgi:hypothetical protein